MGDGGVVVLVYWAVEGGECHVDVDIIVLYGCSVDIAFAFVMFSSWSSSCSNVVLLMVRVGVRIKDLTEAQS